MRTPSSTANRLSDEGEPTVPASHPRFNSRNWPAMKRSNGEIKQLPAPAQPAAPAIPTLRTAQNACYEALSLALQEGHVFAALTGPEGSGKTTVLEAVLSDRKDRALRCIRISDPDKVPASLAEQIENVAYAEAGKPENLERHVVIAVDDAHTASHELILCLSRLAAMREPGRRVPQILLVGRPELWDRLAEDEYEVLARRLAIRAALPAIEEDADPWAVIENEVTQTMSQLRAEAEQLPMVQETPEAAYGHEGLFDRDYSFGSSHEGQPEGDLNTVNVGEVPPPSMFALFPDPPPKAARSAARETRRRLVMPLVSLFVGLAAFAFALSFYDWPDLLGEMPWSEAKKPSTPFVMPRSPQAATFGLPLPPSATVTPPPAPAPPQPRKPVAAVTKPTTPPSAATTAQSGSTQPAVTQPAAVPPSAPASPARQIAVAPPPERPIIPAVPAEAPATPAPVIAEMPARPEPTPPPVAAAPVPVAPTAASTPVLAPVPAPTLSAAPVRAPSVVEASVSPVVMALLLRRGDEESAIGDISAARLLYERAAESGSGLAARQLARSYDPAFLPPAVANTLADIGRAKQWYQRAASLGNTDAASRLKVLNQGR